MATITNFILSQNPDYVYPLALNVFVALIPVWSGIRVSKARKQTGLKYPLEYHPGVIDEKTDAQKYLFNCTQRASQVNIPPRSASVFAFIQTLALLYSNSRSCR